jgi:hypothetical protein
MCLGRCSKACSSATAALLKKCAISLLATAVKQTAAFEGTSSISNSKQQSTKAVTQLLKRVDPEDLTAATAAAQFLSISNVPKDVALELMGAGVTVSFEQLMQAVRARTAGVEVWVSATAELSAERAKDLHRPRPWLLMLCNEPLEVVSSSAQSSIMVYQITVEQT